MKKAIALLLILATITSFGAVTAAAQESAPEGTPITDAAGFSAMQAGHSYYLANDITIDSTYPDTFEGTLDGNGKTITTSAPLFTTVGNATIRNLTIAGRIVSSGRAAALIVKLTKKSTVVIENVINNCDVTSGKDQAAAFIAYGSYDNSKNVRLTVKNCVNNATISGYNQTGSAIGYFQGSESAGSPLRVTIDGFTNNGKVISQTNYAGGIIGRVGGDNKTTDANFLTVSNSVNNGEVVSQKARIGGIACYTLFNTTITNCENTADLSAIAGSEFTVGGIVGESIAKTNGSHDGIKIIGCVNRGNINTTLVGGGIIGKLSDTAHSATSNIVRGCINYGTVTLDGQLAESVAYLGGIVGYTFDTNLSNTIENSLNLGKVTGTAAGSVYAAGILGFMCSDGNNVSNNLNLGSISLTASGECTVAMTFCNTIGNAKSKCKNNYSVAVEGVSAVDINGGSASTSVIVTSEELESGKIAYLLNSSSSDNVNWYQLIGTDANPTPAETEGAIIYITSAGGYTNNPSEAATEETVTTLPESDSVSEPTSSDTLPTEKKGCAASLSHSIAIIILAGSTFVFVFKKKH